jgi:Holliday junction resolvasome RuvABC endonuclease subunit
MKILALDLGTKTGWALGWPAAVSGTWVNKAGRYDGGGMRYLRFRAWLTEVKSQAGGLDAVYFEEVRNHAAVDAAHVYGGFLAHLTAWCEEQVPKVPYQGVPVGTIKKHATGKGNASKDQMVKWAEAHLGRPVVDDNEADAVAILGYAHSLNPQGKVSRPRVRVRR